MSPELRAHFGAPGDRGVLIDTVRAGSPAARAGIHVGDIVVEIDGDAARSAIDMLDAMSDRPSYSMSSSTASDPIAKLSTASASA
jgi:S1-C subfamily serine protease